MGDLVECQREGIWRRCRVSRVPSDARPHDGSFRVKFDTDAVEMKCWYKAAGPFFAKQANNAKQDVSNTRTFKSKTV